ncbi:hypothetical protein Rvan_1303 [Rhodomicrobium vannielii ATCC 17100]|uniref:DUF177 domain-containing protein n=1 Tax=Rhodomicrobium vannielii (strain ATCC 17100 / DSM 162 / LMG 4299 / NCIMB 10020 / ATH 3.1.1) TaxID=648757 RepID=E3I5X2_RHOVT|nr:hypothetical protein [Rhodomicrobium vannielii]ADP70565.1 hypothetical protein Rvan_1303 [Rhodomicrobium vannielii ATCC 17100]
MLKTQPLPWAIDTHTLTRAVETVTFEADAAERAALGAYAEVREIKKFAASVQVIGLNGGRYRVSGRLEADIVQASVVDLADVPATLDERFQVEFWPPELIEGNGEDEPSFEAEPPEALSGAKIPIGAFLCELFSVSLEPYPRNEGDSFAWQAPDESNAHPFAELIRLRPKTGDDGDG